MPVYTRLIFMAAKAVRRLPPEQRKQVMRVASKQARKHGPTIARHLGTVVKKTRRPR